MRKFFKVILSIPKYIGLGLVWVYKTCISPFLPHVCKYIPSCSTYAALSIKEWGFARGVWLATKRLFRCNPFSKGGLDPVKTNIKGEFKWLM